MKKFDPTDLEQEVEAAKKYYFGAKSVALEVPPHLLKEELLKKEIAEISNASNAAPVLDKFEGHQNYKELVNELNYPRGVERTYKPKKLTFPLMVAPTQNDVLKKLNETYKKYKLKSIKKVILPGQLLIPIKPFHVKGFPTEESAGAEVLKFYGDGYEIVSIKQILIKGQTKFFKHWKVIIREIIPTWEVLIYVNSPVSLMNQLDSWYKAPFYGRIGTKHNLIYTNYFIYHNIAEKGEPSICVFDFVATAFKNMQTLFNKLRLSSKSKHLKTLKAKFGPSSTIRLEKKYKAYLNTVYEEYVKSDGFDLKYSDKLRNYDDFYRSFVEFLINEKRIFTFTSFAESLNADIYDSYLVFDIKKTDALNSDTDKLDFLNDINYPMYAHAAKESGFLIDPNKPWRLVADVSSDRFLEAIRVTRQSHIAYLDKIDSKPDGFLATLKLYKDTMQNNADEVNAAFKVYKSALDLETTTKKKIKERAKAITKAQNDLNKKIETFGNLTKTVRSKFNYDIKAVKKIKAQSTPAGKVSIITALNSGIYKKFFREKTIEVEEKREVIINTIKQLSFSQKPVGSLRIQEFYESIYSNIYDYEYFTYFPTKVVEFYNRYIKKYPNFGSISFQEKKAFTKFTKDTRQPHLLKSEQVPNDFKQQLYDFKYLKDYMRLRNSENNKKLIGQKKKILENEIKSIYQAAIAKFAHQDKVRVIKNRIMQLIELTFGTPYSDNLPIDGKLYNKSSDTLFLLKETWDNKEIPHLMLERFCLSPEEPFIEEITPDPCEYPFPGGLPGAPGASSKLGVPSAGPGGIGGGAPGKKGVNWPTGDFGEGGGDIGKNGGIVIDGADEELKAIEGECMKEPCKWPKNSQGGYQTVVELLSKGPTLVAKYTRCIKKCIINKVNKSGPIDDPQCPGVKLDPDTEEIKKKCLGSDADKWCESCPAPKFWMEDEDFMWTDPGCQYKNADMGIWPQEHRPWAKGTEGVLVGGGSCFTRGQTIIPLYSEADSLDLEIWKVGDTTYRYLELTYHDKAKCPSMCLVDWHFGHGQMGNLLPNSWCKGDQPCWRIGIWIKCAWPPFTGNPCCLLDFEIPETFKCKKPFTPAMKQACALSPKMAKMYDAIDDAGTDEAKLKAALKGLTPEQRCYMCRRPEYKDGNSILAHIQMDLHSTFDDDKKLAEKMMHPDGYLGCEAWFGRRTFKGDDWFGERSAHILSKYKSNPAAYNLSPHGACAPAEGNCGKQFWSAADCKEAGEGFGPTGAGGSAKAPKGDHW